MTDEQDKPFSLEALTESALTPAAERASSTIDGRTVGETTWTGSVAEYRRRSALKWAALHDLGRSADDTDADEAGADEYHRRSAREWAELTARFDEARAEIDRGFARLGEERPELHAEVFLLALEAAALGRMDLVMLAVVTPHGNLHSAGVAVLREWKAGRGRSETWAELGVAPAHLVALDRLRDFLNGGAPLDDLHGTSTCADAPALAMTSRAL